MPDIASLRTKPDSCPASFHFAACFPAFPGVPAVTSEWYYLAGYCFRAMKALPLILFTYPLGRRGHVRLVVWGMERLVPLCLCLCCCSVLFLLLLEGGRMLSLPDWALDRQRHNLLISLALALPEKLGRRAGQALRAAVGRAVPQSCLARSSGTACPAADHRRHEFAVPLPLGRAAPAAAMGVPPLACAPAAAVPDAGSPCTEARHPVMRPLTALTIFPAIPAARG